MQACVPNIVVLIIELINIGIEQIFDHRNVLICASRIFEEQENKMMMLREIYDFILLHLEDLGTIEMSFQDCDFPRVKVFFIWNLINYLVQVNYQLKVPICCCIV